MGCSVRRELFDEYYANHYLYNSAVEEMMDLKGSIEFPLLSGEVRHAHDLCGFAFFKLQRHEREHG